MELFNADERRVKALFIRASPPMLTNPPLAIASSAILALLAALLVFAVYFSFRFGCEKFRHGYRAQELPSDYAFSSSTAVRALETTRLAYTAPVHPDIRRFNPIIFRVFDRSGVSSAQYGHSPITDQKVRTASSSRGPTPRAHTPDRLESLGREESVTSQPQASESRVRFVDEPTLGSSSLGGQSIEEPSSAPSTSASAFRANPEVTDRVLVRFFRSFRGSAIQENTNETKDGTAWYQSTSQYPLPHPPDITKSPHLRVGDLFYHASSAKPQLWLRALDAHGVPYWQETYLGYKRPDGRRLVLTESMQWPSWVSENTYNTKFKKRIRDM